MKFIGVDFGWTSGASGLCCLEWQNNSLRLLATTTILEIDHILSWIDNFASGDTPALVAVDAPTVIINQVGMRLAEKLVHKHFGRYHAGCYPANLNSNFADRTVDLSLSLAAKNFQHAPTIEPKRPGRYQIEVFPHPATINLFGLGRILKYKKGKLAERQQELIKLREYIVNVLPTQEPAFDLISLDKIPVIAQKQTGKALKTIEDQLDSLLCAYIGAHWWYWGTAKNLVLGDLETGYIIIPNP